MSQTHHSCPAALLAEEFHVPRFISCRNLPLLSFCLVHLPFAALVVPVYLDAVTIVIGAIRSRIRKVMGKTEQQVYMLTWRRYSIRKGMKVSIYELLSTSSCFAPHIL